MTENDLNAEVEPVKRKSENYKVKGKRNMIVNTMSVSVHEEKEKRSE